MKPDSIAAFQSFLGKLATTLRDRGHSSIRYGGKASRLDEHGIAYAVIGGMALGQHGVVRMTEDVDFPAKVEGYDRTLASR